MTCSHCGRNVADVQSVYFQPTTCCLPVLEEEVNPALLIVQTGTRWSTIVRGFRETLWARQSV